MAKALKRGAYHVYYCYFNCDLRFCSDRNGISLSVLPEPEHKIEELSSEERLKRFTEAHIFHIFPLKMRYRLMTTKHTSLSHVT